VERSYAQSYRGAPEIWGISPQKIILWENQRKGRKGGDRALQEKNQEMGFSYR